MGSSKNIVRRRRPRRRAPPRIPIRVYIYIYITHIHIYIYMHMHVNVVFSSNVTLLLDGLVPRFWFCRQMPFLAAWLPVCLAPSIFKGKQQGGERWRGGMRATGWGRACGLFCWPAGCRPPKRTSIYHRFNNMYIWHFMCIWNMLFAY